MSKKETKLNVLLAKTDALGVSFKNNLKDYGRFFKGSQGAFLGAQNTYSPKDDAIDEPKRRSNILVQTTVDEKLKWLTDNASEYVNALFSQERTNSEGTAKAELVVNGESWGEFTSLELLRLKSILENGDLKNMYNSIPVRSDAQEWNETSSDMYKGRSIYETPLVDFENKTTDKEDVILEDPNIKHLGSKTYTPVKTTLTKTRVIGEGTRQNFTGEWSQRQRAGTLKRLNVLHVAVIEALKIANDCEVKKSKLTADKLFNYLHTDTENE